MRIDAQDHIIMKYSIEHAGRTFRRAPFIKQALVIALSGALGACAMAPGMQMVTGPDASGAASGAGTQVEATAATPAIPITELDLGMAKRLASDRSERIDDHVQRLFDAPGVYTVGVGDVLQIVVWDHPELAAALGSSQGQGSTRAADPAAGFVVDQNGALHFPYAGAVQVLGLRTDQIQERLAAALSKYLVKPQVTVRMASYRSREVYVDGEVRAAGAVSLTDVPLNFYDAIARAGGFSDNADQSDVALVRGNDAYRINVPQLLAHGMSPSRLYLRAGDLLRITSREDNAVYVMGEVTKPGSALPRRDGRLSLADAIAQVGSINSNTADTAQMFVIRSLDGKPEVFHLDSRSPVSMLVAKEFELRPKDIVYVDGNALVRFNRVMTLLLPLINTGLTAGVIAK
jgi:polysaccharide biosynthesis/export protein